MANQTFIVVPVIVSPLLFTITSILSYFWPGNRPVPVLTMSSMVSKGTLVLALYGSVMVSFHGLLEGGTPEISGLAFTVRLDPLTMLMFSMIALLGFIIIQFSRNYLDGDVRQGVFMGRLSATIAAVQLLGLSGNLLILFFAWVLTSLMLHRLLIFYPERRRAVVAARKKFIFARLGDVSLLAAFTLIYLQYSTGNPEAIFNAVRPSGELPLSAEIAALLLAIAALLKSAQFPTQGWLIEAMETHSAVKNLVDHGWINLLAMDEAGRITQRYEGNLCWASVDEPEKEALVA